MCHARLWLWQPLSTKRLWSLLRATSRRYKPSLMHIMSVRATLSVIRQCILECLLLMTKCAMKHLGLTKVFRKVQEQLYLRVIYMITRFFQHTTQGVTILTGFTLEVLRVVQMIRTLSTRFQSSRHEPYQAPLMQGNISALLPPPLLLVRLLSISNKCRGFIRKCCICSKFH